VKLQLPVWQYGRVNLDESLFRAMNQAGSNIGLDVFMVALAILGMTYVLVFAGPLLWWKKRRELGFDVVVLIIVSDLVVEALKLLFMRERPSAVLTDSNTLSWGFFTTATSMSFPSGHASRAFAMAVLIAFSTRHRVGALMLVFAALVGLSRIYLGLHWPSDVLAGALLGVLLAVIMRWVGKRNNPYTRARARCISWLRGLKRPVQAMERGQSS
jgi:undecaprenyl-diphosphatase